MKLKRSLIAGLLAAVVIAGIGGEHTGIKAKQVFLFPQFTWAASSDRNKSDDKSAKAKNKDSLEASAQAENDAEITYSFKIAEVVKKYFA